MTSAPPLRRSGPTRISPEEQTEGRPDLTAALTPNFDTFSAEVDAANAEMPWGYAEANTWYRNSHGRVAQNWPFRLIDYRNRTRAVNPADYTFS